MSEKKKSKCQASEMFKVQYETLNRPSDRVQKKMENYAEIFGNVMRRKLTILQKRHQIMGKFLK